MRKNELYRRNHGVGPSLLSAILILTSSAVASAAPAFEFVRLADGPAIRILDENSDVAFSLNFFIAPGSSPFTITGITRNGFGQITGYRASGTSEGRPISTRLQRGRYNTLGQATGFIEDRCYEDSDNLYHIVVTGTTYNGLGQVTNVSATVDDPFSCAPRIDVDHLQRNFGEVEVGRSAALRKVTITNDGARGLRIDPVLILGANRSQFTLPAREDGCSGLTLSPSGSCRFRVGFEPTSEGLQRAVAVIESNDPDNSEIRVNLLGTGVSTGPTGISVDHLKRNFGEVDVGVSAVPRRVTITNDGTQDLHIAPIRIRGANRSQFTLLAGEDGCSGVTLARVGSCRFRVGFKPTATGLQRALAVIESSDPAASEIRVQLRGTGVEASSTRSRDLVLINGNILTMDDFETVVSAVRIRDGRFVAVGDDVGSLEDPGVKVVDLGGRTVIPGLVLIDSRHRFVQASQAPGPFGSAIESMQHSNSLGLTTIIDPGCCSGSGAGYETLYDLRDQDRLSVRIRLVDAAQDSLGIYPVMRQTEGALRDLQDLGARAEKSPESSGASPLNPWISIHRLVTGKHTAGGRHDAALRLSRLEALYLYTKGSAGFSWDEDDLGSIEVGKQADLAVLNDDYLSVPYEEIRTLYSVLTLVGGEVVHAGDELAPRPDEYNGTWSGTGGIRND